MSGPKSSTYVLESGEDLFTDPILVELRFHGGDDIIDNGTINGGLEGDIHVTRPSST